MPKERPKWTFHRGSFGTLYIAHMACLDLVGRQERCLSCSIAPPAEMIKIYKLMKQLKA